MRSSAASTSSLAPALSRAGYWLLHSGVQDRNGGVARYYRADLEQNLPISTEITGYAVAGYSYLFELSQDEEFLQAARRAGDFLVNKAWNAADQVMPFELTGAKGYSYFFDCGIITRGLLWLWRLTQQESYLATAKQIGKAMQKDFRGLSSFHPIILLPCKSPAPYEIWWSRMPGAFQLKSALAWKDLAGETGEAHFDASYEEVLRFALRRYAETLDNEQDKPKLMDRLHAWSYFLEGLQPVKDRPEVRAVLSAALERGEELREELAGGFLRSDVCAQLLRVKLLDGGKAKDGETARLEGFQFAAGDPRTAGSFAFGRRDGELTPHANPVSTVFAIQALAMASAPTLAGFDWRKLY